VSQSVSRYDSGHLIETHDADGNTNATFAYDGSGNLSSTTDSRGFARNFGYDSNGNQASSSYTWTGPAGSTNITTTTEYDAQGRATRTIDALGNSSQTFYTALGKADYTIDKLGNTNSFFYDSRGNLIQTTGPDALSTRTVYSGDGKPIYTSDRNGTTGTHDWPELTLGAMDSAGVLQ
jgi:YD repeat-containing protein